MEDFNGVACTIVTPHPDVVHPTSQVDSYGCHVVPKNLSSVSRETRLSLLGTVTISLATQSREVVHREQPLVILSPLLHPSSLPFPISPLFQPTSSTIQRRQKKPSIKTSPVTNKQTNKQTLPSPHHHPHAAPSPRPPRRPAAPRLPRRQLYRRTRDNLSRQALCAIAGTCAVPSES